MEPHTTYIRALRLPQVINKTGISRSQIFRMMKTGNFPQSYNLSDTGCIVAWNETEIVDWLKAKFSEAS
ncbi:MAG: AlpA family phage regulatory protein [Proteobacteria bacterium]|nr:AlpA family phage regulatory protein [Pseudomonadota bacterium]